MSKTGTRKKPKAKALTWADLFKTDKPYEGPSPHLYASKSKMRLPKPTVVIYSTDSSLRTVTFDDSSFEPIPRSRVRLYTDSRGHLHIADKTSPSYSARSPRTQKKKRVRA